MEGGDGMRLGNGSDKRLFLAKDGLSQQRGGPCHGKAIMMGRSFGQNDRDSRWLRKAKGQADRTLVWLIVGVVWEPLFGANEAKDKNGGRM